jgi:hypothetical protein
MVLASIVVIKCLTPFIECRVLHFVSDPLPVIIGGPSGGRICNPPSLPHGRPSSGWPGVRCGPRSECCRPVPTYRLRRHPPAGSDAPGPRNRGAAHQGCSGLRLGALLHLVQYQRLPSGRRLTVRPETQVLPLRRCPRLDTSRAPAPTTLTATTAAIAWLPAPTPTTQDNRCPGRWRTFLPTRWRGLNLALPLGHCSATGCVAAQTSL